MLSCSSADDTIWLNIEEMWNHGPETLHGQKNI